MSTEGSEQIDESPKYSYHLTSNSGQQQGRSESSILSDELNFTNDSFEHNILSSILTPSTKTAPKFFDLCPSPGLIASTPKFATYQSATEEMNDRLMERLKHTIPSIDFDDIHLKRQFAPIYAQSAYTTMLEKEYAVGDYIGTTDALLVLNIIAEDRSSLVRLMAQLNEGEKWKDDIL